MRLDRLVLTPLLWSATLCACSGEETGDAAMRTALEPEPGESVPAELPATATVDDDAADVTMPSEAVETEAGEMPVDIEDIELQPTYACEAQYEGPPVQTPAAALPTVFETEICNGRDSRVTAFEVSAGRPVTVTLENPASMEAARVSFIRADAFYELLPVSEGANEAQLGLLASTQMKFTPEQGGVGALYVSGSISRGEPMRLLIEQE